MKSTQTTASRSTAQRRRVKAAPDVRDLIRRDHETLLGLLNRLCSSRASPAARTRALQQLAYAAPAHDKPEERAVYSALRKASEKSAGIAYEGKIEHGLVSDLLAKLGRAKDIGSPRATAQAKVLKELLEHHIEEEHSEMFERLGKDFGAAERAALGASFLAAKQAYARQHPARRQAAERAATKRARARTAH